MDDFDLRDLLSPPLRYQSDLPPKPHCPPQNASSGQVLAMAYVPPQEWDALYPAEQALLRGTLFAQLDYPFEGGAPQ